MKHKIKYLLIVITAIIAVAGIAWATEIPTPESLTQRGLKPGQGPIQTANTFIRIPYRVDGVLDENGRFTLFEKPELLYKSPGLNCSGLVVTLSRYLFDRNITLEQATYDRLNDSGPDAPLGDSWDFGWDLILNLSEGMARRVVMPDGKDHPIDGTDGRSLRGFDLLDDQAWEKVFPQFKPGYVYLASFSRSTSRLASGVMHYHVGLILADGKGGVWLYQTTRTGNTYRSDLTAEAGMNRFKTAFRKTKSGVKHILILEVDPGKTTVVATKTAAVEATAASEPMQPELSAPDKAYVGQLFEVRVENLNPDDKVVVEWLDRKVTAPVDSDSSGHSAMILLGTDVKYQKAGKTGLKVRLTRNGKNETLEKTVALYTKDFGEQRLTVAKRMVNPAKKDLERIKKESKIIGRALRTITGSRMWADPFKRPVPGKVGSVYGLRRIFNGQPRSPHRGLDLDANMGDPVRSCNRGRVILTGDHYYAGQSVYVDHGLGLISMYIHLSKILVQEGQMVEKGDVIGQVGRSGRVTGPHLHFGLYSLGLAVDPLPLFNKGS
jgi:murein DD-endopeptidase MepM/ murein hydrolase activator NlpD